MSAFTYQKSSNDVTDLVLTPADFTDGIWVSDEKATSTNDTVLTSTIEYEELTPDGSNQNVDFRLQAVVQGKEDNGKWYNLVSQNSSYFRSETASVRKLVLSEATSDYEPGQEFFQVDALGNESVATSHEQGLIPSMIRLCIVLGDINSSPAQLPLTSVKVSATGTLK